ncbi:hypothetical protein HUS23_13535 [Ectothiorhodospiraceae bacterium 2226]|nr:hypothetical protein HUS23_13535 [Ectothiorhodospiraceae bacterium 2226]
MKRILLLLACLAILSFGAPAALADEPRVQILSPSDGEAVDMMEQTRVEYEVVPGPRGDHVHVYVDGNEVDILRQLTGGYTLATLEPGEREVCIKVVNRAHVPIGVEDCVTLAVQ